MSESPESEMNLTGQMLIAMPGMGDPRFAHSVVLLCAHSSDGAMGLIVNKSVEGMALDALFDQLSIPTQGNSGKTSVYFGGPVETGRGFVLHTPDYRSELSTLEVDGRFSMTATQDILEDIAAGKGPSGALVALGYAGWGPGQLEGEIVDNGWLIAEPSQALVFHTDVAEIWAEAIRTLGIDPITLSATAGHA